jgi:hypothetical protein
MEKLNFGIAILALFISAFVAYWQFLRKPKIKITYEDREPFRKYLRLLNNSSDLKIEWFIRIKVENKRRVIAQKCFGKIVDWYTESKKVENFDPIKLHWVSNPPEDYSSINLSYKEFDYLDIFLTNKDLKILKIYSHTHPRGSPVEFDYKLNHLIKIAVYGENEYHKFHYLKVWYEEEDSEDILRYPRVSTINENEFKKLTKYS